MPQYEFYCLECQKEYTQMLTLAEYERGAFRCPKCGSTKVEQRWAVFTAITSKKS